MLYIYFCIYVDERWAKLEFFMWITFHLLHYYSCESVLFFISFANFGNLALLYVCCLAVITYLCDVMCFDNIC